MADMMNFPKRWEDFLHDYEFEDARRIYDGFDRNISDVEKDENYDAK